MFTRRQVLATLAAGGMVGGGPRIARAALQPSPPFELTNHQGERFRTDQAFKGRPMLVYFGYTYCPDICPLSLLKFAAALGKLEADGTEVSDLAFLFITVDPKRDTVATLSEYAPLFHPRLIGATGSEAEIEEIAAAWGVKYGRSPGGGDEDYLVDHPPYAFGLDRSHQVVSYLWHVASEEKLASQILALTESTRG